MSLTHGLPFQIAAAAKFSTDLLDRIDVYWHAANYLSRVAKPDEIV